MKTFYGIFIILNTVFAITIIISLLAWVRSYKPHRGPFRNFIFNHSSDVIYFWHAVMVILDGGVLLIYLGDLVGQIL